MSEVPHELANMISKLVLEKFSDLTNEFTTQYAKRKVLAGIVMTNDNDITVILLKVALNTITLTLNYLY
jgi:double stranded RNA-specific editase B